MINPTDFTSTQFTRDNVLNTINQLPALADDTHIADAVYLYGDNLHKVLLDKYQEVKTELENVPDLVELLGVIRDDSYLLDDLYTYIQKRIYSIVENRSKQQRKELADSILVGLQNQIDNIKGNTAYAVDILSRDNDSHSILSPTPTPKKRTSRKTSKR